MWVTKLLISPVKKGFFAQKRPNLAQNWHFWSIWARPCRLLRCPVSGSVGGCGARAVSRKTPIYFIYTKLYLETLVGRFTFRPPAVLRLRPSSIYPGLVTQTGHYQGDQEQDNADDHSISLNISKSCYSNWSLSG